MLQPRDGDTPVDFSGTKPVPPSIRVTTEDIHAVAAAYGIDLDEATATALQQALPPFPPQSPPAAAAAKSTPSSLAATHLRSAIASQSNTVGGFLGGLLGAMVGGVAGILAGPAGVAAGAVAGASAGYTIGSHLPMPISEPERVISAVEHGSEHGCCVDLQKQTYPVGWIPWIGDLKSWRTYDPTTVPGVGVLVGARVATNGTRYLVGRNLMTKQEEVLTNRDPNGHYSWVFHPSQAIIYTWNSGPALSNGTYIRHSQLGGGKPVACAGEWTLADDGGIGLMIASINDRSGHYKPDGGKCMGPVLDKLRCINIDPDSIKVTTR
ncbi:hypothetical protein DVS28_b0306 (plasmid) [Euzebya pacifica]|uniref:Uncharacterized protein n=2 Tax=Euzebya pacifica TaxID=1608957 RepID=A0A346Y6H9_9ACTN|nr:hypothetical protein DVS28_b0306 [Euzebya pacifica]